MKKYIQPKIKLVTLDPEQVILQVCQLGGVYMQTQWCLWPMTDRPITTFSSSKDCPTAVRGNISTTPYIIDGESGSAPS